MPKKRLTELTLDFVSAVDRPAQEPATVAILKRKEGGAVKREDETAVDFVKRLLDEGVLTGDEKDAEVKKATILTTETQGHTHLVYTGRFDGGEDKAGSTSWSAEHTHPWIRDNDGNIVIGAAEGHTHEVEVMVKSKKTEPTAEEAVPMSKNGEKSPEVVALEKKLAEARSLAELTDVEKGHYFALDAEAQPVFLSKSKTEREAEVNAAKADDPVVYKAIDGTEYRKSDDARLVKMARQADDDRKALAKERDARRTQEYAKRAEAEFGHLVGDTDTKVVLLKAVDEITDEDTRRKVTELLKATDNGIAEALKTRGTMGGTEAQNGDANAKLEELAREHAKAHNVTFEKAYAAVIETPEGRELYSQHVEANPTR